ncbi:MAG: hypothetical protein NVV74_14245 [Magnetospirillum sp.]|nr:hypothetical protein [Magnetospirillum sp.]
MVTLKDILVRRYGYNRDDFGSAGLVRLDLEEGTLSPVPLHDIFTPHRIDPAKVVRLTALFSPGQQLTLMGVGRAPTRRFTVLMVSGDGLMVEGGGARELVGWEILRHGLMRPELLVFDCDLQGRDEAQRQRKKATKSLCTGPRLAL